MQPLLTCEEMRAADRAAIAAGIPGRVLMENAATAALRVILAEKPSRVDVFCGKGNNGGDGFAVARRLYVSGVPVRIVLVCEEEEIKGDALENFRAAKSVGVPVIPFSEKVKIEKDTLICDAILGTGVRGEVEGKCKSAIEAIEKSMARTVSLDIPSGISGDTGKVCGCAVTADKTVTFGYIKTGLLSPLSKMYTGEILSDDISIPAPRDVHRFLIEKSDIRKPVLLPDCHKGHRGHAALLAGSRGMTGAALLATTAAEAGGAGLVTALVPEDILPVMMARVWGAMCRVNTDPLPQNANAVLVGCGIGRTKEGKAILKKALMAECDTLIIDADGLYHLAEDKSMLRMCRAGQVILTPHMGEMSRLCGRDAAEITENRVEIAESFAKEHGVTVVLKGAGTVVAKPEGKTYINMTGNPGMAKGGSGDILAGLMLGFAASGWKEPAQSAVFVHGYAGDLAAKKTGELGITAEILVKFLPEAIKCM